MAERADLPHLSGARHRDVVAGGVRLHVAELGEETAPPLLLVHGWPQHWWCWRHVAPLLAERFRCVMPDLRGHGWSEAPAQGYEKDQLADDVAALIEAMELGRPAYIGHDWGAYIGFLLGIREPAPISALLALSIPHPWPSRHDRLSPRRAAAFAYQLPLSTPVVGSQLMRRGLTRTVLRKAASPGSFDDEELDVFDRRLRTVTGARTTTAMYRTFVLRELPPALRGRFRNERLTIPARLIVGDRDPIVRGADLEGFEANAPNLTIERVPGVGHFLPEERPQLVAERALALF